ncbi:MAG: hypothetical protein A2Z16_09220 [Chloroflexi bacterium RBG_16_54_18]|nr:MAG: hypothetical protein A2Z16_09220 [Chloroflexi bacterium RBG_16_54_18]
MDETLLNLLIDKNLALPVNRPLLLVILGPYAAAQAMLTLAAHLALGGPLQVLDGGNRFNAYIVARQLRRLSTFDEARNSPDLRSCLDRIRVARAFTCYQMAALIDQACPDLSWRSQDEARAALNGSPTLVIDLLDTFYDESAPLAERRRLAEHCMQRLRQSTLAPQGPGVARAQPGPVPSNLREPAPAQLEPAPPYLRGPVVVVSLRPPPPGKPDPTGLQEMVQAAADTVLIQEGPAPVQKPHWHSQRGPWPGQEPAWESQGESWHSQGESWHSQGGQPKLF